MVKKGNSSKERLKAGFDSVLKYTKNPKATLTPEKALNLLKEISSLPDDSVKETICRNRFKLSLEEVEILALEEQKNNTIKSSHGRTFQPSTVKTTNGRPLERPTVGTCKIQPLVVGTSDGQPSDVPTTNIKNNSIPTVQIFDAYIDQKGIVLSHIQQKVLSCFLNMLEDEDSNKTIVLSRSVIANQLKLNKNGVKAAIKALVYKGCITSKPYRSRKIQGSVYTIQKNGLDFAQFFGSKIHHIDGRNVQPSTVGTSDGQQLVRPTSSSTIYLNNKTTTQQTVGTSDGQPQQIKFIEFISDLDFTDWPELKPETLVPYMEKGTEMIQYFLDAAKAVIDSKKGSENAIKDRHSFLFSCLKKGLIQPPEGFKTREERTAEEKIRFLEEKRKRLRVLKEKELKAAAELLYEQMTTEEVQDFEKEVLEQANAKMTGKMDPPKGFIESLKISILKEKAKEKGIV